jgi:Domain of unknown function (DUF5597)
MPVIFSWRWASTKLSRSHPLGSWTVSRRRSISSLSPADEMAAQITAAQADGRIRGFSIAGGSSEKISLAGYDFSIAGARNTAGAYGPGTGGEVKSKTKGYGLVISTGNDAFLMIGRGISVNVSTTGADVEVDSAQEGSISRGRWMLGRTLNGDERFFLVPNDSLRIVQLKLLRR